ncbi:hypothetical protein R1sor_022464 [Riccia sorocarpa]|uniref:Uncharacterized protein n=1 Tax=Riccia sorocarpa TaxID=122646 RepID=A0ABD3GKM5_9MARC
MFHLGKGDFKNHAIIILYNTTIPELIFQSLFNQTSWYFDIVPCLSVGDDDDSNPIIDNKMDMEQTAKKTSIKDVLGFLVHKLEDAILPDDYTHVGVTLALDFSKSPRLTQTGKWIDLNNVENLHKYHNLKGYLHLVNDIFGGAKGDLEKPFKPVVIRDKWKEGERTND